MAGSGVAVRLHEFRESQDSSPDEPAMLKPKSCRLGRDVLGLYPGQLGRVHTVPSKDCGYRLPGGGSQALGESLRSPVESFDLRTLRALTGPRHRPAVQEQRPHQTAYQQHFQAPQSFMNNHYSHVL